MFTIFATAQDPVLSDKHASKLERIQNPAKKFYKYKRYYQRDSTRLETRAGKYWKAKTDSLVEAMHVRQKAVEKKQHSISDNAKSKVYQTVYLPWARREATKQMHWLVAHDIVLSPELSIIIRNHWCHYYLEASQDEHKLARLKKELPGTALPKPLQQKLDLHNAIKGNGTAKLKGRYANTISRNKRAAQIMSYNRKSKLYQNKFQDYKTMLPGEGAFANQTFSRGEEIAMKQATKQVPGLGEISSKQGEMKKLQRMSGEYKLQMGELADSAKIREEARQKAQEAALAYITENPAIMKPVLEKTSLLMKKYTTVPNSNDLSTATRANSLKGKPFKERLFLSGNFQLVTMDPPTIDASSMAGYRFNRDFLAGVGVNYRQSFSDSLPRLSPDMIGYKVFASYDVLYNIFLWTEFDRNTSGLVQIETTKRLVWKNAAFAGVGKKVSIIKKIDMTVTLMYNFMHEYRDPFYPKRWAVNVGVQSSALAFFKPK